MKYDVTVAWKGSGKELFTATYVLDWDAHRERSSLTQKTVHHLAGTMRDVDKDLKGIEKALGRIGRR